jgi:hypothetical protein
VVSGTAVVAPQTHGQTQFCLQSVFVASTRPGCIGTACHRHERRWLGRVTRCSEAPSNPSNRWRLCDGGRLQLLRSRSSLAPPSFGPPQRPPPPLERLRFCFVLYIPGPANLGRLLSLTSGIWRPPRNPFGWLRPITFTQCSLSTVAGTNRTLSKPKYMALLTN